MKSNGFIYLFIALVFCLAIVIVFILGIHFGMSIKPEKFELEMLPTLSVIGAWFGAFATCSAVLVSLWLAFKQLNQDKEILDCRLDMLISPNYQAKPCIGLVIVSKGNKPANILSLSWHCSHARTAIFVKDYNRLSGVLPVILSYGQMITLMHVEDFEIHLANYINEYADRKFKDLYLLVNTSTETIKLKVSDSLLSIIENSIKS